MRNSEFYAGWLRPNELEDGLLVRLTAGPRPSCFIVESPRRTGSFDTPDRIKTMSALVPHLQQALRTQDKLSSLAHSSADLAGALAVVRHGTIIAGSARQVINLNTAAERILHAEDGPHVRSGHIAATSVHTARKLDRALRIALTDQDDARGGQSFTCDRPSGKRPYVLHVLPGHRTGIDETSGDATALGLIVDPEHEPEPAAALLRRLYGLTNTEADIALRIGRGAGLRQISEELSVSPTTVRTHLQHVFEKTDTHRQAELVRRLFTLCP